MKKFSLILFFMAFFAINSNAVLKEKDLSNTLDILREELTKEHKEQERRTEFYKQQNEQVRNELFDIMNKSSQNSLMLYSQKTDYVFDLTYACHEATQQFVNFKRNTLPFLQIIEKLDDEVVRYDSLVVVLEKMPVMMLDEKAKIDRNVCLTYAVNIRRTLMENRKQLEDYVRYYDHTEKRLKYLNDYANLRYAEIQSNIFKNGGDNYLTILSTFRRQIHDTGEPISAKYQPVSSVPFLRSQEVQDTGVPTEAHMYNDGYYGGYLRTYPGYHTHHRRSELHHNGKQSAGAVCVASRRHTYLAAAARRRRSDT